MQPQLNKFWSVLSHQCELAIGSWMNLDSKTAAAMSGHGRPHLTTTTSQPKPRTTQLGVDPHNKQHPLLPPRTTPGTPTGTAGRCARSRCGAGGGGPTGLRAPRCRPPGEAKNQQTPPALVLGRFRVNLKRGGVHRVIGYRGLEVRIFIGYRV